MWFVSEFAGSLLLISELAIAITNGVHKVTCSDFFVDNWSGVQPQMQPVLPAPQMQNQPYFPNHMMPQPEVPTDLFNNLQWSPSLPVVGQQQMAYLKPTAAYGIQDKTSLRRYRRRSTPSVRRPIAGNASYSMQILAP